MYLQTFCLKTKKKEWKKKNKGCIISKVFFCLKREIKGVLRRKLTNYHCTKYFHFVFLCIFVKKRIKEKKHKH